MSRHVGIAVVAGLLCLPVPAFGALTASAFLKVFGNNWHVVQAGDRLTIVGRSTKAMLESFHGAGSGKFLSELLEAPVDFQSAEESLAATHLTYVQTLQSEPVWNLNITFSFDRAGFLVSAAGRIRNLPATLPRLQWDKKALRAALTSERCEFDRDNDCSPLESPTHLPAEEEIVGPFLYATESSIVYAYRLWQRTENGITIKQFVIDGSGTAFSVLEELQVLQSCSRGRIFNPNPRGSKGDLRINRKNLGKRLDVYSTRRIRRLEPGQGGAPLMLIGKHVRIDDTVEPPDNAFISSANGSFMVLRGEIEFAAVMLYVHIDAMQEHVQKLGFSDLANYAVRADPLIRAMNAFSDTTTGAASVMFGRVGAEGVFVAEDGDVIAHEYGHVLQAHGTGDRFKPDITDFETAAISEGFSDYWSMSYFRNRNHKYPKGIRGECFGEWMNQARCERVINVTATRDNFCQQADRHINGSVWTGTLWAIAEKLGHAKADQLILESHRYGREGQRSNFCDAGLALLSADSALWQGAHAEVIEEVLIERKIFGFGGCDPVKLE